ncbi:hypothetical protein AAIP21_27420 [Pseudomonas aeruginosa]
MIKNDSQAPSCTCPSGDGSLVHPCPAHPAVEQAGGDERAAFEAAFAAMGRPVCRADYDQDAYGTPFDDGGWTGWQARAALAQPSPAQAEQAEAERPEVVAYRTIGRHEKHQHPHCALNYYKQNAEDQAAHWRERGCEVSEDELMTVAQHDRIVGALRAELESERNRVNIYVNNNGIRQDNERLRAELRAALARVAEMERQEPVALANRGLHAFWVKWTEAAAGLYGPGIKLYAAPVAQAQHSVPDGYRLIRLEHFAAIKAQLDPEQVDAYRGRNIYDEDKVYANWDKCRSALDAIKDVFQQIDWDAENELAELLAAAPGKEVPQAWLDVQAERRRQVEAEGWTPEHDDEHSHSQMARAAACYALAGSSAPNDGTAALLVSLAWPWDQQWWKPTTPRRDLVKACALALAEIERLDRAAATQGGPSDA